VPTMFFHAAFDHACHCTHVPAIQATPGLRHGFGGMLRLS
jgi:hypothetical protein